MKIIVYGSKPAWGTPDLSPFVIKLETWLRLAGLPYERRDGGNPMQAPRGKIPYLEIDGERLGDSQVIIEELTRRLGVALDAGLTAEELAVARLARRTLEEGTYFTALRLRWLEEDGWALQQPAFKVLFPAFVAPIAMPMIRRQVRNAARVQGIGRYTREEVIRLAADDLGAIETLLGDRPYLLGDAPRSVDATVYAFLVAIQKHPGDTAANRAARSPRLLAYTERLGSKYWPPTELARA
jgi:glutathione S-transferase